MPGRFHSVQVFPERSSQYKTIICGKSLPIRETGIDGGKRVSGHGMMFLRHITPVIINERHSVKGVPFRVCGVRKRR